MVFRTSMRSWAAAAVILHVIVNIIGSLDLDLKFDVRTLGCATKGLSERGGRCPRSPGRPGNVSASLERAPCGPLGLRGLRDKDLLKQSKTSTSESKRSQRVSRGNCDHHGRQLQNPKAVQGLSCGSQRRSTSKCHL